MATAPGTLEPTTLDAATLLTVLKAVRKGDFTARLPDDWIGVPGKVADTFNEVVEMNERLAAELARLSVVVGRNGKIEERASLGPVTGAWSDAVKNVNSLVTNLAQPTAEAARVIGAVAKGDLSQRMTLEIDDRPLEGEFMRTAKTVNRVVEQLASFADHRLGGAHEFAFERPIVDLERHALREIALGDRADDPRRLGGRLRQVGHQAVHVLDRVRPGASDRTERGTLLDLAVASDDHREPRQLGGEALVHLDDFVEGVGDLAGHADPVIRK